MILTGKRSNEMGTGAVVRMSITVAITILPAVLLLQVKPELPIKTTICDLVAHPDRYDGKLVQIRGRVESGMEAGGFRDTDCLAYLTVDSLPHPFARLHGEFAFIKSLDDLKEPSGLVWKEIEAPAPTNLDENESYITLLRYLKKARRNDGSVCFWCPLYTVTATATGRFEHLDTHLIAVRASPTANIEVLRIGFAHLNAALSRLVLRSVWNVLATPIDSAIYEKDLQ